MKSNTENNESENEPLMSKKRNFSCSRESSRNSSSVERQLVQHQLIFYLENMDYAAAKNKSNFTHEKIIEIRQLGL